MPPANAMAEDTDMKKPAITTTSVGKNYTRAVSESAPPPIGVFWDIENCSVPFGKSALSIVSKIRDKFFEGHREADFMCVCDISKENKDVIQELNNAQVTVVHINATSKNTADDKIRQALRRFAADHPPPATIVLISGDVNFASELSDLRYRHHLHVILIHRRHATSALLSCAHEHFCFDDFVADVDDRTFADVDGSSDLLVSNLPVFDDNAGSLRIRARLRQLGSNCRGRVISVLRDGTARMRFPNREATLRAQKRMDAEDVYGCKIRVNFASDEQSTLSGGTSSRSQRTAVPRDRPLPHNVALSAMDPRRSNSFSGGSSTHDVVQSSSPSSSLKTLAISRTLVGPPSFTSAQFSTTLKSSTIADFRDLGCHVLESVEYGFGGSSDDERATARLRERFDSEDSERDVIICGPEEEVDIDSDENEEDSGRCRQGVKIAVSDSTTQAAYGSHKENTSSQPTAKVKRVKKKKKKKIQVLGKLSPGREVANQQARSDSSLGLATTETSSETESNNLVSDEQRFVAPSLSLSESAKRYMEHPMDYNVGRSCSAVRFTGPSSFQSSHYDPFAYRDLGLLSSSQSALPVSGGLAAEAAEQHPKSSESAYRGYDVFNDGVPITSASTIRRYASPDITSRGGSAPESALLTVMRTPTFRRTPGARRPSVNSASRSFTYHCPPLIPRPLFAPACIAGSNGFNRIYSAFSVIADPRNGRRFPSAYWNPLAPNGRSENRICAANTPASSSGGVELIISNLDYNISMNEWKKILQSELQQQVQILSINMQMQADNTSVGFVQVPSAEEANHVIAQFHRKKIGYKRIHVALHDGSSPAATGIKFRRGISVSELYQMRDVIDVTDREGLGKMVLLTAESLKSPQSDITEEEVQDSPVCRKHIRCITDSEGRAYADAMDMGNLPHVVLQLRGFSTQVHILLQHHDGILPLNSFPFCYAAEFTQLHPVLESGVPLEHLITCVSGVQLKTMHGGLRKIQWAENRSLPSDDPGSVPHSQQLTQFSHDVVDLLRHSPQCRVLYDRFIPAFHHHSGRQCRVSEYGFTKLIDLLDSIPHVAQVIGAGSRRYVTLTHRAQVKRFTADIQRLLKSQASKQISVAELPAIYNKLIGRTFDITDYGLCFVEDMLAEMTDLNIVVNGAGVDLSISLPRREQTADEVERTKKFAVEAVDLLKHCPRYRLEFSRFIPAYHHHFGKQCRVADFGFTKLIELLEAIPHVVQVELAADGQQTIALVNTALIQDLTCNVLLLLMDQSDGSLLATELIELYRQTFGGAALSVDIVKNDLQGVVQVTLANSPVVDSVVKLCAVHMFARDARTLLLLQPGCRLALNQFERIYLQYFGINLAPASYGYPSLVALVEAVPLVLALRGKTYHRRMVMLTSRFQDKLGGLRSVKANGSPSEWMPSLHLYSTSETEDDEVTSVNNSMTPDLLSVPVPSSVPSPELQPVAQRPPSSLMHFESFSSARAAADFLMLTEDEKRGLKTPLCRTPVSELLQFAAQFLPVSKNHNISSQPSSQHIIDFVLKDSLFSSRQPDEGLTSSEKGSLGSGSFGYPPMPAAAEHISVVQERIMWDSFSLAIDPVSPVIASAAGSVDAQSPKPADAQSPKPAVLESPFGTPFQTAVQATSTYSKADTKSGALNRSNTPRRSRVVARFGAMSSMTESPSGSQS